MKKYFTLNSLVQIGLTVFTLLGFLLVALKLPQYGVISSLISQIFWLYSSYQAWRQAAQIGIFIVSIVATIIFMIGVVNYWFI